ncbi:MAG: hypothetical protein LBJ57_01145 [Prevotellaceae bacterium]|nr:hypothetical protein [Prevotellaceae bacterium]
MKKVKATFLLAVAMAASCAVAAQLRGDMRPAWTKTAPNPPAGANYFLSWGVGEGRSEQQATNEAWADALRKSLHELGVVGITNQDIDAVAQKGIDAVASFNKMKRRVLCTTEAIPALDGASVKVYILIQVQRSVHGKDDLYSADNMRLCSDPQFDKKLAQYKEGRYDFSPRVFVPGMAQLYKGSAGKGVAFIAGEVACIGGLVVAESMRASYTSKINATHDPNSRIAYSNSAASCRNVRRVFTAGAVALYAWSLIDGWVAKGKTPAWVGDSRLSISPCFTPEAGGVAFALNF